MHKYISIHSVLYIIMTKKAKMPGKVTHSGFLRTFSSLLLFLFIFFLFSPFLCVLCSSIVQVFVTSEILHNFGGDKELEIVRNGGEVQQNSNYKAGVAQWTRRSI